MELIVKIENKIDDGFEWLNAEDKDTKDKVLKTVVVFGAIIGAIALVGFIDNPSDY